jgi:hypothetical protein
MKPQDMSKTQQRELKAILAAIGRVLRPESYDDVARILLYRAQTLADSGTTKAAHEAIPKAG